MITVTVDARKALAKFSPSGIPEQVRSNLRRVIPDLTKRLGANVEARLNTQLQSRNRLKVDKLMREDSSRVIGQVTTVWTGESSKSFIPQILESGAKAHAIVAKNASALAFLWPKVGPGMFFFKQVWHPGFPGIWYMRDAFKEMETEIVSSMTEAVRKGAKDQAA